jgi:hypothetical protein
MNFTEAVEALHDGKIVVDVEDSTAYRIVDNELEMGVREDDGIGWWSRELAYFEWENVTSTLWEVVDEKD